MKVPKLIVVDINAGTVTIDGEELGCFLAQEPVTTNSLDVSGLDTVRFTLVADAVRVVPKEDKFKEPTSGH